MDKEMERWEKNEGIEFLRRIGIESGQKVLDFGAGVGHYSILVARIVGSKGRVYALEKIMIP